jgi:hypothetical protein
VADLEQAIAPQAASATCSGLHCSSSSARTRCRSAEENR